MARGHPVMIWVTRSAAPRRFAVVAVLVILLDRLRPCLAARRTS